MDRNKLKLVFLLTIVALPIGLATVSYQLMQGQSISSTSNNGELIIPVIDITEFAMQNSDGEPVFQSFETMVAGIDAEDYVPRPWSLLFLGTKSCDQACGDRLFYLRQLHRLLGADESRVARYYVNVGSAQEALDPRTQMMFSEAFSNMTVVYSEAEVLGSRLQSIITPSVDPIAEHYIFVADPLGNVMLYFTPDNTAEEVLEDLETLLDRSSLG